MQDLHVPLWFVRRWICFFRPSRKIHGTISSTIGIATAWLIPPGVADRPARVMNVEEWRRDVVRQILDGEQLAVSMPRAQGRTLAVNFELEILEALGYRVERRTGYTVVRPGQTS
jgi:hypothetical protein